MIIMDGYDDDTTEKNMYAESDQSTRVIKRRRVYEEREYYKASGGWWQELQVADLSEDQTPTTFSSLRRNP